VLCQGPPPSLSAFPCSSRGQYSSCRKSFVSFFFFFFFVFLCFRICGLTLFILFCVFLDLPHRDFITPTPSPSVVSASLQLGRKTFSLPRVWFLPPYSILFIYSPPFFALQTLSDQTRRSQASLKQNSSGRRPQTDKEPR